MKNFTLFVLIAFSLLACQKQVDNLPNEAFKSIILKERDSKNPWVQPNDSMALTNTSTKSEARNNFLGCSFPTTSLSLIGKDAKFYNVINIDKIRQYDESLIHNILVNNFNSYHYSYANSYNYIAKTNLEQKISYNLGLDLKVFSFANKATLSKIFRTSFESEASYTFGEICINWYHNHMYIENHATFYEFLNSKDYFDPIFKNNLYSYHPSRLIADYGRLVVFGYLGGGSAKAFLTGKNTSQSTNQINENNFDIELGSSYKIINGNFSMGKDWSSSNSQTGAFSEIKTVLLTSGGTPHGRELQAPSDIKGWNINLNSWVESLQDPNKHVIADITTGGLVPIADLPIEKNLRDQLMTYTNDPKAPIKQIQEPYIEINYSTGGYIPSGGEIYTILNTRFGDKIKLRMYYIGLFNNSYFEFKKQRAIEAEVVRVSKLFGLRIVQTNLPKTISDKSSDMPDWNEIQKPKEMYNWFNEENLSKIEHNGDVYIYSNIIMPDGKKYAFSLRKEQFIYDNGLKELIDRLPVAPAGINVDYIYSYCTIFAL